MDWEHFNNMVDAIWITGKLVLNDKGHSYAHSGNPFANFERLSNILGTDRKKILLVYLFKHIDAITAYINGQYMDTEPVQGRIVDAINYLTILYAMIEEENKENEEDKN